MQSRWKAPGDPVVPSSSNLADVLERYDEIDPEVEAQMEGDEGEDESDNSQPKRRKGKNGYELLR
jgi:hypothetical protein